MRSPSLYITRPTLKVPIASTLIVSSRSRPRLSRCVSPNVSITQFSVCLASSLLPCFSTPPKPLTAPMMNPSPAPPRLGSPFDWDPSENPLRASVPVPVVPVVWCLCSHKEDRHINSKHTSHHPRQPVNKTWGGQHKHSLCYIYDDIVTPDRQLIPGTITPVA